MGKRALRDRKVSAKMGVVDEGDRQQALAARLDALEDENARHQDAYAASDDDDDEFVVRGDSDGEPEPGAAGGAPRGRGRKKAKVDGGMRKTRGMLEARARGPRGFRDWLDEAGLGAAPPGEPTYLTAAMGPPRCSAPRPFCAVCGDAAKYRCTRCGARYCSLRCNTTHVETRCLKFAA